jgi:ABC-type Fe3+/spermidine/putrescine transport system ATPase subunit
MSQGKVLQVASPEEIYQCPVNVEVADFIGQMNFIDASVTDLKDGEVLLDTAGLGQIRASANTTFIEKGANIVVAIRPEKLTLSKERRGDCKNATQGVIKNSAYLGDRRHFYVSVQGCDKPLAVAAQEVEMSAGQSLDQDSAVWLSWADESIVLLNVD